MGKRMTVGQAERQLAWHAKANVSEYVRTVVENTSLEADLRKIRRSFELPLADWKEYLAYVNDRLAHQDFDTLAEFKRQINSIVSAHHVEKWRGEVEAWALYGTPPRVVGRSGFPGIAYSRRSDGIFLPTIVIPEDFDASNPHAQAFLMALQWHVDPCPQPIRVGVEMDFRPVWEWYKRHPNFSQGKLAEHLGYTRPYLNRRLKELDTD